MEEVSVFLLLLLFSLFFSQETSHWLTSLKPRPFILYVCTHSPLAQSALNPAFYGLIGSDVSRPRPQ